MLAGVDIVLAGLRLLSFALYLGLLSFQSHQQSGRAEGSLEGEATSS